MNHLDLFSGIGGFAIAVDEVWPGSSHAFCEIDPYCQALLKKRYPRSVIYGDIRTLTNTDRDRSQEQRTELKTSGDRQFSQVDLLTGGFPCQPFSCAGKRKGVSDNRFLWPEMLRVIREFQPTWVIAENVRGILTIEQGMVFESVCLDLENEGYEVQAFVIPAVACNAPHRRDRVWFVANRTSERPDTGKCNGEERYLLSDIDRNATESEPKRAGRKRGTSEVNDLATDSRCEHGARAAQPRESARQVCCEEDAVMSERPVGDAPDLPSTGRSGDGLQGQGRFGFSDRTGKDETRHQSTTPTGWEQNWLEVATELCRVDDGLPAELHGLKLSKSRHRVERLKALGNAIVPQVAMEIMKAIENTP